MRKPPPLVSQSVPVSQLLGELQVSGSYEAIAVDDGKTYLVTMRDVLPISHPERTRVRRVSRRVRSLGKDSTVLDAVSAMIGGKRRAVPIMEGVSAIGILSQAEVVSALAESRDLEHIKCRDIMRSPVACVSPRDSISVARSIMLTRAISHLPVVERQTRLVGILTAKAIVESLIQPREKMKPGERTGEVVRTWDMAVKGLMDRRPLTAREGSSVLSVIRDMKRVGKQACVVKAKKSVDGIITPIEIVGLLLRFKRKRQLPVYIVGLPETGDFRDVSIARDKIMRIVKRSLKLHPDIQEVIVSVDQKRKPGKRTLYTIRARAYSPTERIVARSQAWYLSKAFDQLCEKLDRRLRKAKHEPPSVRSSARAR